MAATSPSRFIRLFFGLTAAVLLTTGLVNLAMDPMDLFGMPKWPGINAEKSQYQKFLRMAKAHEVRMRHPQGIILGTSRAENLDPDHPGWSPDARPAYNLALQSARIYEALHYLRHAHAQRPLKQVVLALDLFMFEPHVPSEQGFDETRLDKAATPELNGAWANDLMMALFSFDALRESFLTFTAQKSPSPVIYLGNGARHPTRFQAAIDQVGGHHWMFLKHLGTGGPRKARAALYDPYAVFRQILEFCRKERIDLRLMINPEHAWALEKLRITGIAPEFAAWKRQLVNLLAAEAQRIPGAPPYPLWDFSGFNSITTETVPGPEDRQARMLWYWEYSHYKAETGTLMLDRVFGIDSHGLRDHPDFGVLLTTANIDQQLWLMQTGDATYRRTHPDEVEVIARALRREPNNEAIE